MKENNVIKYYTLEEAKEEFELQGLYPMESIQDMIQEAILHDRRRLKYREQQRKIFMSKQHLFGAAITFSGIIVFIAGDGMYSLFALALGMYLMLAKEKIIDI